MAREIISVSVCALVLPLGIRVLRVPRRHADWPSKLPLRWQITVFPLTTLGIGWQPSWKKLLGDRSQGTRSWR